MSENRRHPASPNQTGPSVQSKPVAICLGGALKRDEAVEPGVVADMKAHRGLRIGAGFGAAFWTGAAVAVRVVRGRVGERARKGKVGVADADGDGAQALARLFGLAGRRALVTARRRGSGWRWRAGLAAAGASVVLNGRDQGRLDAAAAGIAGARTLAFDVTDHGRRPRPPWTGSRPG